MWHGEVCVFVCVCVHVFVCLCVCVFVCVCACNEQCFAAFCVVGISRDLLL